jgi:hypothetical protein
MHECASALRDSFISVEVPPVCTAMTKALTLLFIPDGIVHCMADE